MWDTENPSSDIYRDRLRWLSQLRWWAMIAAMCGAVISKWADWNFVSPPGIASGVVAGVIVNVILLLRIRMQNVVKPRELSVHALVDLLALTWLLVWAGGLRNPLCVCFSFHVLLGALLSGRQGTLVAGIASLFCMSLLLGIEYSGHLPTIPVHDPPQALWLLSLLLLLAGLSYFSLVLVGRLRRERLNAQRGRGEAERSLVILSDALDALNVGLEVLSEENKVLFSNPYANSIFKDISTQRDWRAAAKDNELEPSAPRPQRVVEKDVHGRARFFDVMAIQPTIKIPLQVFLYVDRTEERKVEQRQLMLERQATLGRAMQGVAHELNTPLTTMQVLARDLQAALSALTLEDDAKEDLTESISLIVEESLRCRNLTQSLLSTAHLEGQKIVGENCAQVVKRAIRMVGHRYHEEDPKVALDASLDFVLDIDSSRMMQIMMNLIQNAFKATETIGDTEHPHLMVSAVLQEDRFRILIDDAGQGISDEIRDRLFEPFVSSRPVGEGTGLGLYTSLVLAQEKGGNIHIEDRHPQGTRVVLEFPRKGPPPSDN
jgi:signal transduction histidine kinase